MANDKSRRAGERASYEDFFDSGSCIGYSEVFPDDMSKEFVFEFEGKTWTVDDQYCMNPSCPCNEIILSFIDYVPGKAPLKPSFVISLSMDSGAYSFPKGYAGPPFPRMDEIIGRFLQGASGGALRLLKDRFRNMKARGRELAQERQLAQERRVGAVPGRNEICPCGSGKKYKKCCGR
jgi:hypothetical protein